MTGPRPFLQLLHDARELAACIAQVRATVPGDHLQAVEQLIRTRVRLDDLLAEMKWSLGPAGEKALRVRLRRGCPQMQDHPDGKARSRSTPGTGIHDTPKKTVAALLAAEEGGEPLRLAAKRLGVIYSAARHLARRYVLDEEEELEQARDALAGRVEAARQDAIEARDAYEVSRRARRGRTKQSETSNVIQFAPRRHLALVVPDNDPPTRPPG